VTFYQKYVCISREHDGYKFLNNSQDAHEIKKNPRKFCFSIMQKEGEKKIVDHKKIIHFVCCDFIIHENLHAAHLSQLIISWEMKNN